MAKLPHAIGPKDLAVLTSRPRPFNEKGWVFELKMDGFRVLVTHAGERISIQSRRGTNYLATDGNQIANRARTD